jgi:hypothetical protein
MTVPRHLGRSEPCGNGSDRMLEPCGSDNFGPKIDVSTKL